MRSVELNEGLRAIGVGNVPENALEGREVFGGARLERVRLPDSLRTLGPYAFAGIASLREVELGEDLEEVGRSSFARTGLESVRIPAGVEKIAEKAFEDCVTLREVCIPLDSRLEVVGSRAFAKSGLRAFKAPAGLRRLGREAFAGAGELESVQLKAGLRELGTGEAWELRPGRLGVFAGTRVNDVELSSQLEKLGRGALAGLQKVFVPDTLQADWARCVPDEVQLVVRRPSCDSGCGQSGFQSAVEASASDSQVSVSAEGFCQGRGSSGSKLALC